MKKIFAGILAVVLCLGLVGCTSNEPVLGAVLSDGKTVKLGDSREDAEKILGEPTGKNSSGFVYHDDSVSVQYREDAVVGIMLSVSGMKVMNVEVGEDLNALENKISGEPITKDREYAYIFTIIENRMQFLSLEEWDDLRESGTDDELKQHYLMSFAYSAENKINWIMMQDCLYAVKSK